MNKLLVLFFFSLTIFLGGCYYDNEEALYPGTTCDTTAPTYQFTISPIISANCLSCHAGNAPSAGLTLSSYEQVKAAVQNKNLQNHVMQQNGYSLMPPSGQMTNCKIDQLNSWVANGMPN